MPREPTWWYPSGGDEPSSARIARSLAPLAAVYGAVAARRIAAAPRYRSKLPVICVGNFTAGGSGKTPLTVLLARLLIAKGGRPAILTRGYGGTVRGPHWVDGRQDEAARVGDEPLLLARAAPVLVCRDRVAGARAIEARGEATVILMDDGLQNPALAKDLRFAVVDGVRGLGNGRVIPAGPLRGPLDAQLGIVDAIVFNGSAVAGLLALFERTGLPVLSCELQPAGDAAWLTGARVIAFAGIGHPARFFETVRSRGAEIVEAIPYPDHAPYSAADAKRLLTRARETGARLITTEKDFVRLSGVHDLAALADATSVLPVEMVPSEDSRRPLADLIDAVTGGRLNPPASRARGPQGSA